MYHLRALSVPRFSTRRLAQGVAAGAALLAAGGTLAATAASGLAAPSGPRAQLRTDRGCYLVGAPVHIQGSGFAAERAFVVSVDDVYFGQSRTSAAGTFTSSLRPGGLPAGVPQAVERLDASDGTSDAQRSFTLTRAAGARLITSGANASSAALQAWGFSLSGRRRTLYLHYLAPSGASRQTVALGRTGGQCGYLKTRPRPLFPFRPSAGAWTLQVDTRAGYVARPRGPVARIRVQIG